jgi:1-acyl-sn-glycerol-3-phosphate acyltransferase
MRQARGALTLLLLALNTVLWGTPILTFGLFKLVLTGDARRRLILFLAALGDQWVAFNNRIFDTFVGAVWDVEWPDGVDAGGHYVIVSNHVSWVDIFVLQRIFHHRTAFVRFFLKHELIWMPIVGQACWALEFPFMKRYSAEYLARHPEKRGTDLETTRRACRRYRHVPVAILNFLEGTRRTREKHDEQESPYRHLLRPRVGGIGFVLASLGEQLDGMFDVTLAYPGGDITFWRFLAGGVPRVVVRVRRIAVPRQFFDAAVTEPGPARDRFKSWVEALWREKDAFLDSVIG